MRTSPTIEGVRVSAVRMRLARAFRNATPRQAMKRLDWKEKKLRDSENYDSFLWLDVAENIADAYRVRLKWLCGASPEDVLPLYVELQRLWNLKLPGQDELTEKILALDPPGQPGTLRELLASGKG